MNLEIFKEIEDPVSNYRVVLQKNFFNQFVTRITVKTVISRPATHAS